MIDVWESIWFWVLVLVLTVFGILTIVVGIGGFFDVQALLRSMDKRHQDSEQANLPPEKRHGQ